MEANHLDTKAHRYIYIHRSVKRETLGNYNGKLTVVLYTF